MRPWTWVLLGGLAATGASGSAEVHSIDEDLGGPRSPYAALLLDLLRQGRPKAPQGDGSPLQLTCIATPGNARYVGIVQQMRIDAPLSAVERILDDVPHYKDLFPGCVDVHVVPGSRAGNRYVTAWEQRVPVFFLPSTRYELTYLVSKPDAARVVYRYRLARAGDLTNSDGMVTLDAAGPASTQFTEYDFYNARWGLLPETAVWRGSLRGVFLSDLAIKLKAENPGWSYERIAAEAERLRVHAEGSLERCRRERRFAATLPLATRREGLTDP